MEIIYYYRKVFSCFKRKYIGYVLISVKSYCAEKYLPIIISLAFSRIEVVTRLALPVSSRRELGRDQNIKWKVGDKSGTPKRDFQFLTIKISHSIENLAFDTLLF